MAAAKIQSIRAMHVFNNKYATQIDPPCWIFKCFSLPSDGIYHWPMPYFQSLYDILEIAKSASADESQLVFMICRNT